jgi:hypothetical protein
MCAFHVKLLSKYMSKYFASDGRISYSNSFSLFLCICFPFVNVTSVPLSVLSFIFYLYSHDSLITVAARSKARTVFPGSKTRIVGSNPTRGMDVCVRLLCVYVVLGVGSGLATGWSPVQGFLQTVYRLRNWKSDQGSQGLYSHRERNSHDSRSDRLVPLRRQHCNDKGPPHIRKINT